jgi:hypothetical protein
MKNQLNPLAAGLSMSVLWGLCMLLCTVSSLKWGYGQEFLELMMDVYPGYEMSAKGAVIGMLYGLADGFIGGFLVAWLYNVFARKFSK